MYTLKHLLSQKVLVGAPRHHDLHASAWEQVHLRTRRAASAQGRGWAVWATAPKRPWQGGPAEPALPAAARWCQDGRQHSSCLDSAVRKGSTPQAAEALQGTAPSSTPRPACSSAAQPCKLKQLWKHLGGGCGSFQMERQMKAARNVSALD